MAQLQHAALVGEPVGGGLPGPRLALGGDLEEGFPSDRRHNVKSPNSGKVSEVTLRSLKTAYWLAVAAVLPTGLFSVAPAFMCHAPRTSALRKSVGK